MNNFLMGVKNTLLATGGIAIVGGLMMVIIQKNPLANLKCNQNETVGFDGDGNPKCVARQTHGNATPRRIVQGKSCGTGEVLAGFDGSGDVVCTTLSATVKNSSPMCFIRRSENCYAIGNTAAVCGQTTNGNAVTLSAACPAGFTTTRSRIHSITHSRTNASSEMRPSTASHRWIIDTFCCNY